MHKIRKTNISLLAASRVGEAIVTDQVGHVDYRTAEENYLFNVDGMQEVKDKVTKALTI